MSGKKEGTQNSDGKTISSKFSSSVGYKLQSSSTSLSTSIIPPSSSSSSSSSSFDQNMSVGTSHSDEVNRIESRDRGRERGRERGRGWL